MNITEVRKESAEKLNEFCASVFGVEEIGNTITSESFQGRPLRSDVKKGCQRTKF